MKKLFLLVFVAFASASCSKSEEVNPIVKFDVISFEEGTGLADIEGNEVIPGEIEVVGGSAAAKHQNVYWAKGGVFDAYTNTENFVKTYSGILCAAFKEGAWFGTYYSDYGGNADTWGGFALSRNYNKTAMTVDYNNQFSAWATTGAKGSKTCLIGYDSDWMGNTYALPTVKFAQPRIVDHLYMANSTMTYAYTPSKSVPEGETYFYKVVITGSLNDVETGKVECVLINGTVKVEDWTKVSLCSLGDVDKLVFKPASNDLSGTFLNDPAYFCIDEIALVK